MWAPKRGIRVRCQRFMEAHRSLCRRFVPLHLQTFRATACTQAVLPIHCLSTSSATKSKVGLRPPTYSTGSVMSVAGFRMRGRLGADLRDGEAEGRLQPAAEEGQAGEQGQIAELPPEVGHAEAQRGALRRGQAGPHQGDYQQEK